MPIHPQSEGLPASVHTEITIIGAMLLDAVAVSDATGKLKPADFSLDSHQRIYRCIFDLVSQGKPVDITTLRADLEKRRELESIGGPAYLAYLTEGVPRNMNIESYVQIVKDKSLLRQLMSVGADLESRAADPTEDAITLLADTEASLAAVADSAIQRGLSGIPEIVGNGFQLDQEYTQGLLTHLTELDKMTHGLQDSELIIVAARPSMGKSALAMNIAQNAAVRDDKRVAVFSLEMSKEALLRRMLAGNDRVATLTRLMDTKLFIDDTPGISLAELRAKSRRLKQQHGLDLILVDYLQLMTGPKSENRTQEVSALSRGLKSIAKELQVPLVALSQLSRANEQRADKRPLLSDLRESGEIEQAADVVAFIHREEYYDRNNPDVKGKAEVIVAKQRNGPTGSFDLAWISACTRFENLA